MASRPRDEITVETSSGACRIFHEIEISNDYTEATRATFSTGDDGSWPSISQIVEPGEEVRITLNGRVAFAGRWEENHAPNDPHSGSKVKSVARTRMADAHYASAAMDTRVTDVSLKTFLISLFKQVGFVESDFVFDASAVRNLLTGEGGGKSVAPIEGVTEGKAKIQPKETVWDAAERHAKRHHARIWCAGDGRVVVGVPNDQAEPVYRFVCRRGRGQTDGNNVMSAERGRDWSEVPSSVEVTGMVAVEDEDDKPLRALATDVDLAAVNQRSRHFHRRVSMPIEGVKSQANAQAQAERELASRSKKKSTWTVTVDGWSFWNGQKLIPYAIDQTVDVDIEVVGAEAHGRFLVHKLTRTIDPHRGATSKLELLAPGILSMIGGKKK